MYRHYLEIKLKHLIRYGAYITDTAIDKKLEDVLGNHDLLNLWNNFQPFFERISGHHSSFEDVKKEIESYINQIHVIDPASFTFRYDLSKSTKKHNLEKIERINILHFSLNMKQLTSLLEDIYGEFDDAFQYVNERRNEASA